MIDGILYVSFFIGGFILVLSLAEAFAILCIKILEKRVFKQRYNSKTREYR